MTDETILWIPSRQQCKDVSSLDARIGSASRRSIVVCTTDYAVATMLTGGGGGGVWYPYYKDPARHQQLREEYSLKFQERSHRIERGRVKTIDKFILQRPTRQLRDQSQEMLDQLSNLDQERHSKRRSKSRCSIM